LRTRDLDGNCEGFDEFGNPSAHFFVGLELTKLKKKRLERQELKKKRLERQEKAY